MNAGDPRGVARTPLAQALGRASAGRKYKEVIRREAKRANYKSFVIRQVLEYSRLLSFLLIETNCYEDARHINDQALVVEVHYSLI